MRGIEKWPVRPERPASSHDGTGRPRLGQFPGTWRPDDPCFPTFFPRETRRTLEPVGGRASRPSEGRRWVRSADRGWVRSADRGWVRSAHRGWVRSTHRGWVRSADRGWVRSARGHDEEMSREVGRDRLMFGVSWGLRTVGPDPRGIGRPTRIYSRRSGADQHTFSRRARDRASETVPARPGPTRFSRRIRAGVDRRSPRGGRRTLASPPSRVGRPCSRRRPTRHPSRRIGRSTGSPSGSLRVLL